MNVYCMVVISHLSLTILFPTEKPTNNIFAFSHLKTMQLAALISTRLFCNGTLFQYSLASRHAREEHYENNTTPHSPQLQMNKDHIKQIKK